MSKNPDPCTMLNECYDKISHFVDSCVSKKELNFQYTLPKNLPDKLKRGAVLNIIVCGRAKSGKSTLVNYLLSSGPDDMEDESKHILPTGKEIRTLAPWIIQDTINLPPGKISVEHDTHKGEVEGTKTFDTITELHKHLKKTYSGHVLKKDHYAQIRLSFGRPNPQLSQGLFSSAVTIIDTEDLSNSGVEAMTRAMQGPSILICCFDVSQDFHRSELSTFKNFMSSLQKAHVILVCTHIEAKLCKKSNGFNYNALLKELKKEVVDLLTAESFSVSDDVFYFDPSSKYEPMCSSVYKLQERLITLRKELDIDSYFCQEMRSLMYSQVDAILNELSIVGEKLLESGIEKISRAQGEKFAEEFETILNSSLEEEIIKLAKERKSEFMKDQPIVYTLETRMLEWLSKEAFKTVIPLLLKRMPQDSLKVSDDITSSLNWNKTLSIEVLHNLSQIVADALATGYGSLISAIYALIVKGPQRAKFKADGLAFLNKVIKRVEEEGHLEPALEKIIEAITSQLCRNAQIQLTLFPPRIMDYIKENTGIDSKKLMEIREELDKIN